MTPQDPLKRRSRLRAALLALLLLNLAFAGAGLLAFAPSPTLAQGGLPANQQAILDQVRSLVAAPDDLVVQRRPDGTYFTDVSGAHQAVLLAATGADGQVVTRCVETLEEAAAFLAEAPTLTAAASVASEGGVAAVREAVERDPALRAAALAASQTVIEIMVADGPDEGFNDATLAAPVGGNPGTTVGQQRLEAFKYAAGIWAAFIQSTVPIKIEAQFDPLFCDVGGAVLGSAGPRELFSDMADSGLFPGAENPDTWYVSALADKVSGADLSPGLPDMVATFNANLGAPDCLAGSGWYYGFDGNEGDKIDLIITLLHEFGHGLGFISYVNLGTGANYLARNDIWNYFVTGAPGGGIADTLWKDMSSSERRATITSNNLVWGGARVTAAAARLYDASAPQLAITSPGGVGPFAGGAASFGPLFDDTAVTGELVAATDLDEDGAAPAYSGLDACNPLDNGAVVSGKVALVSRGACAYSAQVRNLQAAGAIAAVIADTITVSEPPELTGDDSGVTIPAMSVTQAAGDTLRARLADGPVSVSIALARTNVAGLDNLGRVKLYAPGNLRIGSSVSHFDVGASGPNLLMEPSINSDLTPSLDLTDELMRDIGWYPDLNYNGLDDHRELNLSVSQSILGSTSVFASSFVQPGASFTTTVVVRNEGFTTAGVTFTDLIPAGFIGATWTAAYSGGAAGPPSGAGPIEAPLTLPPGSTATFTIIATAPTSGQAGSNVATISLMGGAGLVDTSGPGDDSAAVSVRLAESDLELLFLPLSTR